MWFSQSTLAEFVRKICLAGKEWDLVGLERLGVQAYWWLGMFLREDVITLENNSHGLQERVPHKGALRDSLDVIVVESPVEKITNLSSSLCRPCT